VVVVSFAVSSVISGLEKETADGCGIREDADAQDYDNRGRHSRPNSQLCSEEDKQTRNDDVPKEGRDEDAVRETPFQPGATGAKEGIESSDDGDRQERGEPDGNSRVEQDSQHDSDDQSDDSNHEVPPWFVSTAGVAYSGAESVSASIDNEGETFVETVMPVID